eukprot:2529916-Rhodomonas_salina.3
MQDCFLFPGYPCNLARLPHSTEMKPQRSVRRTFAGNPRSLVLRKVDDVPSATTMISPSGVPSPITTIAPSGVPSPTTAVSPSSLDSMLRCALEAAVELYQGNCARSPRSAKHLYVLGDWKCDDSQERGFKFIEAAADSKYWNWLRPVISDVQKVIALVFARKVLSVLGLVHWELGEEGTVKVVRACLVLSVKYCPGQFEPEASGTVEFLLQSLLFEGKQYGEMEIILLNAMQWSLESVIREGKGEFE